jgi:hypothetical protein
MMTRLWHAWQRVTTTRAHNSLLFDRPLLLLQSDDWGRVGVRDREGWEELRAHGIDLGQKSYDFYSLETAEDLEALSAVLRKHRDSVGRTPTIVMNFIMANIDFARAVDTSEERIPLIPLTEGLPGNWRRPHLFEAYRQGIQDGIFYPAFHGLSHFCSEAISRELQAGGERAQFIRGMWHAETPYIHWRMPWIGYEYWDPKPTLKSGFLGLEDQRSAIRRATGIYRTFFLSAPFSACAPGYRANADTRTAWFEAGVRVVQNGPGQRKAPYLDQRGMMHTFRNIEIEPAIVASDIASLVREAEGCFRQGVPAVVSIHSINFHSTIRDFRTLTLAVLDEFLQIIEKRWPNLLYVHDADLFRIATEGCYTTNDLTVSVAATRAGK